MGQRLKGEDLCAWRERAPPPDVVILVELTCERRIVVGRASVKVASNHVATLVEDPPLGLGITFLEGLRLPLATSSRRAQVEAEDTLQILPVELGHREGVEVFLQRGSKHDKGEQRGTEARGEERRSSSVERSRHSRPRV